MGGDGGLLCDGIGLCPGWGLRHQGHGVGRGGEAWRPMEFWVQMGCRWGYFRGLRWVICAQDIVGRFRAEDIGEHLGSPGP